MKRVPARLSTTHVDRHNEALTVGALRGMIEHINAVYLPMTVEHDPRIAPIGRIASAYLTELEDGEFAVDGIIEFFEEADTFLPDEPLRSALVNFAKTEQLVVSADRAFASFEDQSSLHELATDLGALRETNAKKSVEPIAILGIAIKLADGIASGIGEKIGAEVWEKIRPKLAEFFNRKRDTPEQLLKFEITTFAGGRDRLVEVIVSNPTAEDFDALSLESIDDAVNEAIRRIRDSPAIVRVVFDHSRANGLQFLYGVASNGLPVGTKIRPYTGDVSGVSFGGRREDA